MSVPKIQLGFKATNKISDFRTHEKDVNRTQTGAKNAIKVTNSVNRVVPRPTWNVYHRKKIHLARRDSKTQKGYILLTQVDLNAHLKN